MVVDPLPVDFNGREGGNVVTVGELRTDEDALLARQFTTHDDETELKAIAVRFGNVSKLDVIEENRQIITPVSRQRNHLLG